MRAILAIMVIVLMIGCTQQVPVQPDDQTPVEVPDEPVVEPKTEPTELGVTRVIEQDTVAPGDDVVIKLYVNLDDTMTYYLLEEAVPEGVTVTKGVPDKNNKLKMIEIKNAESKVVDYAVQAPTEPGTYTFSGEYAVEGMKDPAQIMGDTTLTVQ